MVRYNQAMNVSRIVEYAFFFGLLLLSGYMVWLITAPFISALALSAIIVTICQPVHIWVQKRTPRNNKSLAALFTTLLVLVAIIIPLILMSSVVVRELVSFYQEFSVAEGTQTEGIISMLQVRIDSLLPGYSINLSEQIKNSAEWFVGNLGAIFAGTLSTLFIFILSMIGSFYFFRDGKDLMQLLIKASPLPDKEDEIIFARMARAIRAVATGTVLIALIQGTLVTLGLAFVGIERAVLWGSIASLGALMPGIGTTIVTAPVIIYLFVTGDVVSGVILLVWSVLIVGLVDNLIGPYLISRGSNMHPFIILISVLGGILLFGPIGFIVGPVVVTLFFVLLEIYSQYILKEQPVTELE